MGVPIALPHPSERGPHSQSAQNHRGVIFFSQVGEYSRISHEQAWNQEYTRLAKEKYGDKW